MRFNNLIKNILKEEKELSDRERRIQALRSAKMSEQFRVLDTSNCRGEIDIHRDEIRDYLSITDAAEAVRDEVIMSVEEDFINDDDEDALHEFEGYVENWISKPVYNDDMTLAMFTTGEESACIILSSNSKYFNYTEDQLYDSWDEMDDGVDWSES